VSSACNSQVSPIAMTCFIETSVSSHKPGLWLKESTGSSTISLGVFIGVYATVSITSLFCLMGMLVYVFPVESFEMLKLIYGRQLLVIIAPDSASRLHQTLVTTTFNAPMAYFESIETSVILNRFSQDMTLVEMMLPLSVWQLFQCMLPIQLDLK
jgi:ATP-binding cassette subfamily C (CFTR/MRP) protein 1